MNTEEAIRKYCSATGKVWPVNFVDFANWCAVNEPEFNEQLERHAAEVFNNMTNTYKQPPLPGTQPGDEVEYGIRRLTWEVEMRETHRKDLPWVKTNWGSLAKTREEALRDLDLARLINKDSRYKPEFRLLELLTTVIEVKP